MVGRRSQVSVALYLSVAESMIEILQPLIEVLSQQFGHASVRVDAWKYNLIGAHATNLYALGVSPVFW